NLEKTPRPPKKTPVMIADGSSLRHGTRPASRKCIVHQTNGVMIATVTSGASQRNKVLQRYELRETRLPGRDLRDYGSAPLPGRRSRGRSPRGPRRGHPGGAAPEGRSSHGLRQLDAVTGAWRRGGIR